MSEPLFVSEAARIEAYLEATLPASADPLLSEVMRYALLGGGKRLRARLVYATADSFGLARDSVDPIAAALECMHAYSLIHDDLPALDNDALRRGRPSCHKAFSEGMALLAGDALQNIALQYLVSPAQKPERAQDSILQVALLLEKSGPRGMIGGQCLELNQPVDTQEQLIQIHALKTAALFEAAPLLTFYALPQSLRSVALYACLHRFSYHFGIAFQLQDDIQDYSDDAKKARTAGGSSPNYALIYGPEACLEYAQEHANRAQKALLEYGLKPDTPLALFMQQALATLCAPHSVLVHA